MATKPHPLVIALGLKKKDPPQGPPPSVLGRMMPPRSNGGGGGSIPSAPPPTPEGSLTPKPAAPPMGGGNIQQLRDEAGFFNCEKMCGNCIHWQRDTTGECAKGLGIVDSGDGCLKLWEPVRPGAGDDPDLDPAAAEPDDQGGPPDVMVGVGAPPTQ